MISLSLDLKGADELMAKSRILPKLLSRAVKNSLTRTLRRTATTVRKDIQRSGIGRTIWGKKISGMVKQKLVTIIQPHASGESIETGLRFRGIPRLIEEGGRMKAHPIGSRKGADGVIVFKGRTGWVVTKGVKHPGSMVRAHGFGGSALRRDERLFADDVNASIRRVLDAAEAAHGV